MSRLSAALLALLLAVDSSAIETMFVQVPRTGVASGSAVAAPSVTVEVARDFAMVRVTSGAAAGFAAAISAAGGTVTSDLGSGWFAVQLPSGMVATQGLPWLQSQPGVLETQYDNIYRPNLTPNDPLVSSQYGLDQISARQAWDYETGTSARVTVAIIDAGVEDTHVELSTRMANTTSASYAPGTGAETRPDLTVACNHGTRVAGIAAAAGNNGTQIAGVSWGAGTQVVSYRVLPTPCANCACTTDDTAIIAAINRAISDAALPAYGRMVINMSLGGPGSCGGALQAKVTQAVNAGIVLVAASGNSGSSVESPGNCSGVIPVGAVDAAGNVATFSSRGPELASGGLVAPGVSVTSTDIGGTTTASATGTSFAAPHVAGAAALILAAKPTYTVAQVLATLRNSSDPVGFGAAQAPAGFKTAGNSSGAGRLNAFLALQLAIKGQLADFQGEDKVVAFPNPFRAGTHDKVTFAFPNSIVGATDVTIKVYTPDGALVRELNSLTWDTKNEQGRYVASGTYLFVVATSKGKRTGRISVLR